MGWMKSKGKEDKRWMDKVRCRRSCKGREIERKKKGIIRGDGSEEEGCGRRTHS